MSYRLGLAALIGALVIPAHAQLPVNAVRGAAYQPSGIQKAAPAPQMQLEASASARRVLLSEPTKQEKASLVTMNRDAAGFAAKPGRPQFIGFGRDVAAVSRRVELGSLSWTELGTGARIARIEVGSAGAKGLRVAVRMAATHPDISVRFATPLAVQAMVSVPANAIAQATARFGEYWSPVIDGDRVAIEIEAAHAAPLAGVTLEIARVSHLVVGATMTRAEEAKILADIGDSGSCNLNVKCGPPQDAVTFNQAAATGKLVFTVPSGGTARCTGTMLNDQITSFTPYIFGANHCLDSAYTAFTLNVWWFFEATACGNSNVGMYVVQTGGAMLLGRSQDWDWALVRMFTAPPSGTYFSAWNGATIPSGNQGLEIFHHPQGDLKKWSQGTSQGIGPVNFGTAAGGAGLFTEVIWDAGTTEGGSSGGALTSYTGTELEVRGGLLGGDALCSNLAGSDYFSQLGAMIPLVRQYLTPNNQTAGIVVAVEYYHAGLNHYFITIDPAEIAGLDSGLIVGWERTGFRFLAYSSPGAGRNPVCRFYRKPEFGDSHFFTADPAECATVAATFALEWVFENPAIFYIALPNTMTGVCPAGTRPIYRYLNLAEINHRLTTEQTVAIDLSVTPGWQVEGYGLGPLYPVMCSPLDGGPG